MDETTDALQELTKDTTMTDVVLDTAYDEEVNEEEHDHSDADWEDILLQVPKEEREPPSPSSALVVADQDDHHHEPPLPFWTGPVEEEDDDDDEEGEEDDDAQSVMSRHPPPAVVESQPSCEAEDQAPQQQQQEEEDEFFAFEEPLRLTPTPPPVQEQQPVVVVVAPPPKQKSSLSSHVLPIVLALPIYLAIFLVAEYLVRKRLSGGAVQKQMIDLDDALIQAWNRHDQCTRLFIFTGDADSHFQAIGQLSPEADVSMHDADDFVANLAAHLSPVTSKVLLIHSATPKVITTKHVQQIFQQGKLQCKKNSARRLTIVLSTSLGSAMLNHPDQVLQPFVKEEPTEWLTVNEIVMNRHQVVHHIRGNKPRSVFQRFFKQFSQASSSIPPATMMMWQKWFEMNAASIVYTEGVAKILQTQKDEEVTRWLSEQHLLWTKNQTCGAVLYRESARQIGAYNVFCQTE